MMEDDNRNPSTDDDIVRTIMDVYRITEQEARRALRDATINSMTDSICPLDPRLATRSIVPPILEKTSIKILILSKNF